MTGVAPVGPPSPGPPSPGQPSPGQLPPGQLPRLDVWMVESQGVTRHAALTLIKSGLVTVNGRPGRAGHRVRPVDDVSIGVPPPVVVPTATSGRPVHLDVVYEDEWLAVIDKPAGMVVHPAAGHRDGTLADGLRQRGDTWSLAGGVERPGIVHRLDRDTSGLLVVAKSEAAHRALAAQLIDRTLGRTYWTLVHGVVAEATGRIEAPVGRNPRQRQRMAVVDDGRPATSDFTVLERFPATTALEVRLHTGRTHQIRVHMAYIRHPVLGDPLYGRTGDGASRLALHALRMSFIHPGDGQRRTYESPLPMDLQLMRASAIAVR